ncbi:hypothetical protein [Spiroplasma kunkelii]|nr:hypothetical protein [Spiroplasma kunkelii]
MNNVFIQDNLINKGHNVIMNALNYVKKEYCLKTYFMVIMLKILFYY